MITEEAIRRTIRQLRKRRNHNLHDQWFIEAFTMLLANQDDIDQEEDENHNQALDAMWNDF